MIAAVLLSARFGVAEIRSDESVIFFPTAAALSDDGQTWHVPVHGWIFEPEHDDFLRNQIMEEIQEELGFFPNLEPGGIFDQRVRWFLVDNEGGKDIQIRLGARAIDVGESDDDGHFTGSFTIGADEASRLARDGWLEYEAVLSPEDQRALRGFRGRVRLQQPVGVTIISDIDDTIKVTQVRDKAALAMNTFVRPFRAVEGMAALYRDWTARGATLHYVTSSPYQLYPMLSQFTQESNFPGAVWHAKRIRVKGRSVMKLLDDPTIGKRQLIEPVLAKYPGHRFILVGDSGELDPEIYGGLAREHPQRIAAIYIRNVTDEPADAPRYQHAFAEIPRVKWHVFTDPATLTWPLD